MRNTFLLLSFLFVGCAGAIAQNKTLGVGTPTPNPNAALHVESPTNNQGFIMPRMTTAQRTAPSFTSALSTADIGLMVYDTDEKDVYAWEGTQWSSDESLSATNTMPSGNAAYFANTNGSNPNAAVYATTNGTGVTAAAIVGETATAFSAITGRATGGAANAVSGISSDPGAGSFAILGTVSATGGGQAGVFNIANPSNVNNTLEATTNGTGGAAYFRVQNAASTRVALWSETNSNQPLTAAVYGLNTGTGDAAGVFRVNNAGSNKQAVFAETNGSGSSVQGLNLGTGNGAYFRKNGSNAGTSSVWGDNYGNDGYAGIFQNISATNPKAALFAESLGPGPSIWANKDPSESGTSLDATHSGPDGSAGNFEILNAANTDAAIFTSTTGAGPGLMAENDGAANGFAGLFQITQATNTYPAIQATSKGTGSAIRAFRGATDGTGPGVDVFMHNTSSGAHGVIVDQLGSGDGGNFIINNTASSNAAVRGQTNSNSNGFGVFAENTGTGDAVFGRANNGSGGNFQNTNASNNASVAFASTNAQNGHAMGAMNTANGSAFSIFQGGMKISTFEVTTGTTIATRAAAYRITGGGPSYTISFPTATGDMYMVYNDTVGSITFEGVTIPAGTGKIVINFNSGSFRGL